MMRNIVAVLADFAAHVLPPLGKCAIALVFGLAIVPQGPSIRTDALRKRQKKTPAQWPGRSPASYFRACILLAKHR
jgi:hypothetical protein